MTGSLALWQAALEHIPRWTHCASLSYRGGRPARNRRAQGSPRTTQARQGRTSKALPKTLATAELLRTQANECGQEGWEQTWQAVESTFTSHPVTEFTQYTKGRHYTIKRCTCDFRIHLRVTSALTGEHGISSAFFF